MVRKNQEQNFLKIFKLSTAFNISTNPMNKSKNTSTSEHARSSIVSDYEEGIQNKTLIMYSGKKKCNNHLPNSKRKKSQFPINNQQNDIITDQYNLL